MEERSGVATEIEREERVDSSESSWEVPHHTWRPKGKYELEKTEVKYEDVVPIDVPEVDIREPPPPPPKEPTPPPPPAQEEEPVDAKGYLDPSLAPQTNGFYSPTSPIDIPEGIPLLARILPREEREGGEGERIPLERLFTPATDGDITPRRSGKVFASSAFYRPDHPTIEDQVELAQKISLSLVDENNKMSKGQSMYIKRKKRSVKWIHDEAEAASRQTGLLTGPGPGEESEEPPQAQPKEKPPLKSLMSSRGVQDYTQVQEHYSSMMSSWAQHQQQHQHTNLQQPPSPEVNRDIITDLQSPTGKGAALFAKRKKRMDKFIVDETTVQKSSSVVESSSSSSSSSTMISQQQEHHMGAPAPPPLLQARGPAAPLPNAAPTAAAAAKAPQGSKPSKSDRDKQQAQIILADSVCDQASKISIELPKPVPIIDPAPGALPTTFAPLEPQPQPQPLPQPPLPPPSQGAPVDGGAVYTAEVKVVQRASLPPTPIFNLPASQSLLEQMSQADAAEKRQSFNLAAKGWGTYNTFYTPVTFQAS